MAMVKVPKGQRFIKRGEKMNNLFLIVQGKVRQISESNSASLENGNLIGIIECKDGIFLNDYIAEEESILFPFSYEKLDDFQTIFTAQPKYAVAFLQAAIRQTVVLLERYENLYKFTKEFYLFVMEAYREYSNLCNTCNVQERLIHRLDTLESMKPDQILDLWEVRYFQGLYSLPAEELARFYGNQYTLIIGEIARAATAMTSALQLMDQMREYMKCNQEILLGERKNDLFGLYVDLAVNAAEHNLETQGIQKRLEEMKSYITKINLYGDEIVAARFLEYEQLDLEAIRQKALLEEKEASDSTEDYEADEDEADCLANILEYASYTEAEIEKIRAVITIYRDMEDNAETEDAARRLRKEITTIFYDTYKRVFRNSLDDQAISPIIQMFLCFGFMDVQVLGEENANDLYDMTSRLFQCRSEHVYTIYDWLLAIYRGMQEPCRNEFDLDYYGSLNEQKRMGRITEAQMDSLRNDNWEKVVFEIENMFMSTNRTTYGRIMTYCPVLNKKDVVGNMERMLVTVHKLEEAMNMIRKIDYSLFYHEVIFSDSDHGVNREYLQKEIFPDIILMPNIGIRAMMWQETAGMKRDTSARFAFPIFTACSINDMMIETCARYRWEMCRKIQGMRWNDITERSLTSEYCDYVQFFRKNIDLSMDAKEKIKTALSRAKNNYREVFVQDYLNWIKYESNGNFRLNRVARDIIFRYCPFSKSIREMLAENPAYQEIFGRFRIQSARSQKHAKSFTDKYLKNGGELTVELQENLEFYNM